MRTTININDRLLDELKLRAAKTGTTVSRLIEDAVRLSLAESEEDPVPEFRLVTFGEGHQFTHLNIDKVSQLVEHDDLSDFGAVQ